MKRKHFEFHKTIDKLNRIVIPNDLCKAYNMNPGVELLLIPTDKGILIRPASLEIEDADGEFIPVPHNLSP